MSLYLEVPTACQSSFSLSSLSNLATCGKSCFVLAGDAHTDQFRAELGEVKNTPEQLFADSQLTLRHNCTGTTLTFTAKAALQAWATAKAPAVKVLLAQDWMNAREKDVAAHQAVPFEYDW